MCNWDSPGVDYKGPSKSEESLRKHMTELQRKEESKKVENDITAWADYVLKLWQQARLEKMRSEPSDTDKAVVKADAAKLKERLVQLLRV